MMCLVFCFSCGSRILTRISNHKPDPLISCHDGVVALARDSRRVCDGHTGCFSCDDRMEYVFCGRGTRMVCCTSHSGCRFCDTNGCHDCSKGGHAPPPYGIRKVVWRSCHDGAYALLIRGIRRVVGKPHNARRDSDTSSFHDSSRVSRLRRLSGSHRAEYYSWSCRHIHRSPRSNLDQHRNSVRQRRSCQGQYGVMDGSSAK